MDWAIKRHSCRRSRLNCSFAPDIYPECSANCFSSSSTEMQYKNFCSVFSNARSSNFCSVSDPESFVWRLFRWSYASLIASFALCTFLSNFTIRSSSSSSSRYASGIAFSNRWTLFSPRTRLQRQRSEPPTRMTSGWYQLAASAPRKQEQKHTDIQKTKFQLEKSNDWDKKSTRWYKCPFDPFCNVVSHKPL